MEIFVYFLIFMIGAFIGSFASLAVYRLPIKQDILYTHSYCPNCNEKLKTIDLIPIFSYLFLKGKCRNCGKKIRPRYLILEISSGIVTLLFVLSAGFSINNFNINLIIHILFYLIFITTLVLIAGIDKEHKRLHKPLLIFGIVLEVLYLLFAFDIYKMILLVLLAAVLLLKKDDYLIQFLSLIIYTLFFIPIPIVILNLIVLLISTLFMKKQTMFTYVIITIVTLIISNFII